MKAEEKQKLKEIYIALEPQEFPEDRAEQFEALTDDQRFFFKIWHLGETLPTVAELRQKGHKVKVTHGRTILVDNPDKKRYDKVVRPVKELFNSGFQGTDLLPHGGFTKVRIEANGTVYEGEAVCSAREAYCRSAGLVVALSKALNGVEI